MVNYVVVPQDTDSTTKIIFDGKWTMHDNRPTVDEILNKAQSFTENCNTVAIDVTELISWDTSFISFIVELIEKCSKLNIDFQEKNLPKGILNILASIQKNIEPQIFECDKIKQNKKKSNLKNKFVSFLRQKAIAIKNNIEFIGEVVIESAKVFWGKSKLRHQEFWTIVEQVGVKALGIVSLISFLVGLILAFISIIQLNKFGAGIYCADLVGIAMMREMGCLMTAVIMSGRTGAAFAATIGTMMVNEEIDAIKTSGLSCFRFIILPRILALTVMMPLLCIFADIIGIAGGMFAAVTILDMNVTQYFTQTQSAIVMSDLLCGITKSVVFAVLISGIGCLRGMQCGRDAESVGFVTTSAVVTSITSIIIADAIFAVVFNALGI